MKTRSLACSALALAALATSGCGPHAANQSVTTTTNVTETNTSVEQVAVASVCAPGAPTLAATGLCQEQAAALLLAAPGAQLTAPSDCSWTVNEAKIGDGSALLYRAAKCSGGIATLSFVAGARMSSFDLAVSPYGKQDGPADTIAQITDGPNSNAILDLARGFIEDPAERARCHVRPLKMEDYPGDALVVDEVPIPPADGVRSACGTFGLDEDSQTFWRLSQGTAWFFQLGQESPVVDAGSFTLVHRDAAGHWIRN